MTKACRKDRLLSKAGEEIRTLDIHVGNEGDHDANIVVKQGDSDSGGVPFGKYSANRTENAPIDPDLARLVEAWPTLPESIRVGILALISAAGKGDA